MEKKKKELPAGWLNKKRYNMFLFGSWIVLFLGFVSLIVVDRFIYELKPLGIFVYALCIFIVNSIFKNSIVNKERMETNQPMIALVRNIEGEQALIEVNKMLSRDDLSSTMKQKYQIEKVYTLLYLNKTVEAKELLDSIDRPKEGNDLYIYIELCFELSNDPETLLKEEFEKLNNISNPQLHSTIKGIIEYREAILDAEKTGEPKKELREMIFIQKDIFTMLMNQYRIIKIYRNKSRYLTRTACEKILEYANDLTRFTSLAKTVLEELGPVTSEEEAEAERAKEVGDAYLYDFEDNKVNESPALNEESPKENQDVNEDNTQ